MLLCYDYDTVFTFYRKLYSTHQVGGCFIYTVHLLFVFVFVFFKFFIQTVCTKIN